MTRQQLAKVLAKKTGLNQHQARDIILAFGNVVTDALSQGKKIVYSNFGTFYTVHYPSKVINHPKFGAAKKVVMFPTNVAKWMPAVNIKKMVGAGQIIEGATIHGAKKNPAGGQDTSGQANKDGVAIPIRYLGGQQNVIVEPKKEPNQTSPLPQNEPKRDIPVNIYEELMKDGGKEESTFKDTIRIPARDKESIWGHFFGGKTETADPALRKDADGKVSLLDFGVFDKNASATMPSKSAPQAQTVPSPAVVQPKATTIEKELPPMVASQSISNIAYVDLSKTIVPKEILQKLPEKIARKYRAVPVEADGEHLVVAMIDPEDLEAKEIIKKYVQRPVLIKLTTESDLDNVLSQYQGLETEVEQAIEEAGDDNVDSQKKEESTKALIESASDNAPAARIVTSLLRRAIRDKSSDIHIEPLENEVQVRFRIDGILRKKLALPRNVLLAVVSRIKILSNLKIDEQRLPQDGRFSILIDNRKVDFRISTMPTAYGEKVVMRILDKSAGILTIEQLGLEGVGLKTLEENLTRSHGMILVTGPTGSGKTTTLYALIDKLFQEGVNIVTLEDPIEYQISGINQSQVNPDIDYTFANGLRSIVRQDPDIIMIGEIRDGETAGMAVQAALTGHVVLSTLHTNDAGGASPRLIDMGVEPFLLTSSANVIVGQRLGRKLCEECKEEISIPAPEMERVNKIIAAMPEEQKNEYSGKKLKFFKGKGCKNCGDLGYKGRIGIFEVLGIVENIKELINHKASSSAIAEQAIKNGMVTMIQDGIIKAVKGLTSLEEVWRVTKD